MRNWRFFGALCLAGAALAAAVGVNVSPLRPAIGLDPVKVMIAVVLAFLAGFVLRDGIAPKPAPAVAVLQAKARRLSLAASRLRDASASLVNDLVARTVATPETVIRVKLAQQAEAGFERSLASFTRELSTDAPPEGLHVTSERDLRLHLPTNG